MMIEKIRTKRELTNALENGLIDIYINVFKDPPYEEYFSRQEVIDFFYEYLEFQSLIFIAKVENHIIGFGVAVPIVNSDIYEIAKKNDISDKAYYMADLGVEKSYRGMGIARQLVNARLNYIASEMPNTPVIMRTMKNNIASQTLYKSLGFKELPFTQDVSQTRTDGTIKTDTRIFLQRNA